MKPVAAVLPAPGPPPSRAEQAAQAEQLARVWLSPRGWRYWSAVNNSEVGLWYIAVSFLFFLFAGVLALLMRTQLAVPDNDFVSAETYNQLFHAARLGHDVSVRGADFRGVFHPDSAAAAGRA